jgi:hypothetical protein
MIRNIYSMSNIVHRLYAAAVAFDGTDSFCSCPFLYIILVWTSGEVGSSEVALMELADLVLLEHTDDGVSDASVVEQYQISLMP